MDKDASVIASFLFFVFLLSFAGHHLYVKGHAFDLMKASHSEDEHHDDHHGDDKNHGHEDEDHDHH